MLLPTVSERTDVGRPLKVLRHLGSSPGISVRDVERKPVAVEAV